MPNVANARPFLNWNGVPARSGSKIVIGSLVAVSVGIGALSIASSFVPLIGQAVQIPLMGAAHIVDRLKNNTQTNDELKFRAEYYTTQIYKQLELQGVKTDKSRKATVAEFKKAAAGNAELAKLYKAPIKDRDKRNKESLFTNGGIALAGALIPGGGAVAGVAEVGKVGLEASHAASVISGTIKTAKALLPVAAGGLGGGALARAVSGDVVDPQALVEAMHTTIADAKQKGINTRDVISPNMVFLLRVSQDPGLAERIKLTFGRGKTPFHKMTDEEQMQVMQAYPALANAATSEAYALSNDMLPVQELGASKPNLDGIANQYAVGTRNSSFVNRLNAQRAAANGQGATVSA